MRYYVVKLLSVGSTIVGIGLLFGVSTEPTILGGIGAFALGNFLAYLIGQGNDLKKLEIEHYYGSHAERFAGPDNSINVSLANVSSSNQSFTEIVAELEQDPETLRLQEKITEQYYEIYNKNIQYDEENAHTSLIALSLLPPFLKVIIPPLYGRE